MSQLRVDVAIVGAGPAGSSAAISLARRGAKVVLFDSKSFPHHKVCGEFLSPECRAYLDQLGVTPAILAANPVSISTVKLTTPSGISWESTLPDTAWGLSRYSLDSILIDQARREGVEVCESTTVHSITGSLDDSFHLQIRASGKESAIQSAVVIGAYGKRSNLDRALNRSFIHHDQPFVGLKAHFCGPVISDRIELHTFPGGYGGISQIEGGRVNVGILVRQPVFQRAGSLESFITGIQNPYLKEWFSQAELFTSQWYTIAQVPFEKKHPLVNDILMVGDAAGLIAPLAGDGISMALRSGQLAAHQIGAYLEGHLSPGSLRRAYVNQWKHAFRSRLRLGRLLQSVMLRPSLASPVLQLLNVIPPLGTFLIKQTREKTP